MIMYIIYSTKDTQNLPRQRQSHPIPSVHMLTPLGPLTKFTQNRRYYQYYNNWILYRHTHTLFCLPSLRFSRLQMSYIHIFVHPWKR